MATASLKVRCYVAGEDAVTTAQTQTDIYVSSLKSWMCGQEPQTKCNIREGKMKPLKWHDSEENSASSFLYLKEGNSSKLKQFFKSMNNEVEAARHQQRCCSWKRIKCTKDRKVDMKSTFRTSIINNLNSSTLQSLLAVTAEALLWNQWFLSHFRSLTMTVDQKLVRVVFSCAASLQNTQKLYKRSQNHVTNDPHWGVKLIIQGRWSNVVFMGGRVKHLKHFYRCGS